MKNKLQFFKYKSDYNLETIYYWTYVYTAFFLLFEFQFTSRNIAGDFPDTLYM